MQIYQQFQEVVVCTAPQCRLEGSFAQLRQSGEELHQSPAAAGASCKMMHHHQHHQCVTVGMSTPAYFSTKILPRNILNIHHATTFGNFLADFQAY